MPPPLRPVPALTLVIVPVPVGWHDTPPLASIDWIALAPEQLWATRAWYEDGGAPPSWAESLALGTVDRVDSRMLAPVRLFGATLAAVTAFAPSFGFVTAPEARSVAFSDPAITLACLPAGGLCPEIVLGPIWLFEDTT